MVMQVRLLTDIFAELQAALFNDQEKIRSYEVNVGVKKCPPAYVAPVNGAVALSPLPHYERKKGSFF